VSEATTHLGSPPADPAPRSAAAWVYEGVWAVLTRWLRVPRRPPSLPLAPGEEPLTLRLSEGWFRLRKFTFWVVCLLIDLVLVGVWAVLLVQNETRTFATVTAPLWIVLIVAPDVVAYVAIHLQYDTTWYLLTSRSMRLRRGAWLVSEVTITFENVQNVRLSQGPVQRMLGFADLVVETAGGGGSHGGKQAAGGTHLGVLEGVADAEAVKEIILTRVRASRSAGLGDEPARDRAAHDDAPGAHRAAWSPEAIAALRDAAREASVLRASVATA
jgi:membrane protein YdbS with pleckstrin-like domain